MLLWRSMEDLGCQSKGSIIAALHLNCYSDRTQELSACVIQISTGHEVEFRDGSIEFDTGPDEVSFRDPG